MLRHKISIFAGVALTLSMLAEGHAAAADWDYAASLSGRTYSAGLSLDPTLGLHQLIWGDPTTPFFGYIRPALSGSITPTLFAGDAGLDIYPVSFLGMTVAKRWTHRFLEPSGYDCEANSCLGQMNSTKVSFRLLSAYQSYFLSAQYQRQFFEENGEGDGKQNIMDPANALIYRADGSNLNTLAIILGKKVTDKISTGVLYQRGELDRRKSASEADYVFARSDLSAFGYSMVTATVGLGRFNTDLKRPGISAIAIINYTGKAPIGPAL